MAIPRQGPRVQRLNAGLPRLLSAAAVALVLGSPAHSSAAPNASNFGSSSKTLTEPVEHPDSRVNCGPTAGCVLTSDRQLVFNLDRKQRSKAIISVEFYLPAAERYLVSVVTLKRTNGRGDATIIGVSKLESVFGGIFGGIKAGAPVKGPGHQHLSLKNPLPLKDADAVGLYVRGYKRSVPMIFHDTRPRGGALSTGHAWLGRSGKRGEILPDSGEVLNRDPESGLSGKFAELPLRVWTNDPPGSDLAIFHSVKGRGAPAFFAPGPKPRFILDVFSNGPRKARGVIVRANYSSFFGILLPLTVQKVRVLDAGKTSRRVRCKIRGGRIKIRCKTRMMKRRDRFRVEIMTRISLSLPELWLVNKNSGGRLFAYSAFSAVKAGKPKDHIAGNNESTVGYTIETADDCGAPSDGTGADDVLIGSAGPDTLRGLGGNDVIRGEAGHDCLLGGVGDDQITGGQGSDWLAGQDGNDTIDAADAGDTGSRDRTWGGSGNDTISAVDGTPDWIDCGPGKKDSAEIDRKLDKAIGCETVKRTRR